MTAKKRRASSATTKKPRGFPRPAPCGAASSPALNAAATAPASRRCRVSRAITTPGAASRSCSAARSASRRAASPTDAPSTRSARAPATSSSWRADASAPTASTARLFRPPRWTKARPPAPSSSATPSRSANSATRSCANCATSASTAASPTTARADFRHRSARWRARAAAPRCGLSGSRANIRDCRPGRSGSRKVRSE